MVLGELEHGPREVVLPGGRKVDKVQEAAVVDVDAHRHAAVLGSVYLREGPDCQDLSVPVEVVLVEGKTDGKTETGRETTYWSTVTVVVALLDFIELPDDPELPPPPDTPGKPEPPPELWLVPPTFRPARSSTIEPGCRCTARYSIFRWTNGSVMSPPLRGR